MSEIHFGSLNAETCRNAVKACKEAKPGEIAEFLERTRLSPEEKARLARGVISVPSKAVAKPASAASLPIRPEKPKHPELKFGVVSHATEEDIRAMGKVIRETKRRKEKETANATKYKPAETSFNIGSLLSEALKKPMGK